MYGVLLALNGYSSNITRPAVVVGKDTLVTKLDLNRLVLPLETSAGPLEVQVILKPTTSGRV